MMTRNQTATTATAAAATAAATATATVITISNDPSDTVIYPSMFDRWRLPL
jgi:hypothetical protein